MEFNILKTRRGKLYNKIKNELSKNEVNIDVILNYVDQYEKDNLNSIEKLKRLRTLETKKINGAIKQFLNVHPTLTKVLVSSLSKRIYGALLEDKKYQKDNKIKIVLKWIKNLLK
jgi:hypothetical protein